MPEHSGRRPPQSLHGRVRRVRQEHRARREDLAENLAMLRHVVINVLRLDKPVFGGISVKREELTWDDEKLPGLMLAA